MTQIPKSALVLGLAGTLPFLWGAATHVSAPLSIWGVENLGARFVAPLVHISYGVVILCFMSGVLWGFATKARGMQASVGYGLSVIPALWAFFTIGRGPVSDATNLIFGFLGVLILDFAFSRWGLAPAWWMRLRILLTTIVVAALCIGAFL